MSEETLARHIDKRLANGDTAFSAPPAEEDAQTRALAGTVWLAHAALATPAPPAQAEAGSRARVLERLQDGNLSPRRLRAAPGAAPTLWARLAQWLRRRPR